MQAESEIDIEASTVTLNSVPHAATEDREDAGPDLAVLGDLTLPVAFEIDSARVSLDELAALGEGSVIELQVAAKEATVRLVCFGQVVGVGQLMVVGEQLGVLIRRMGVRAVEGRDA